MDFPFPISLLPAELSVLLLKWSSYRRQTAAVTGLAEGFLFLSADVSQTGWLYKGLLYAD